MWLRPKHSDYDDARMAPKVSEKVQFLGGPSVFRSRHSPLRGRFWSARVLSTSMSVCYRSELVPRGVGLALYVQFWSSSV